MDNYIWYVKQWLEGEPEEDEEEENETIIIREWKPYPVTDSDELPF